MQLPDLARPRRCADPGRRRFAGKAADYLMSFCLPRAPRRLRAGPMLGGPIRLTLQVNPFFRSEGPKSRTRTASCSSGTVRTERPGPPYGGPERVNSLPIPAKGRFKTFYSWSKPENLLSPEALHNSPRRPSFVWVTHPCRPVGPAPPLSVRAHVAPKRLPRIRKARCLCAL